MLLTFEELEKKYINKLESDANFRDAEMQKIILLRARTNNTIEVRACNQILDIIYNIKYKEI